jgi:MFS family permease
VFGKVFFGNVAPAIGTVLSFVTLLAGYLARPIGGVIFGHFGDRLGRRRMLLVTMAMMGVATTLIGVLPTYAQIGVAAPVLLVVLRVVQGVAVGGDWGGSATLSVEASETGRRGLTAAFVNMGAPSGAVVAALVLALFGAMPDAAFLGWGWRIPFLLSALVVVAGYIIRRRVDETPAFQEESEHGEVPKAPIVQAVKENGADMLRVICMALMNAIPTAVTVFGATFATNAGYGVGMTTTHYLWISVVGNIIAVVLIPFVGNLTDSIGRRPVMIVGCLGSGILAYPYLYFVAQGNVLMAFIFAMIMWGCVYQGYNAVFPAFYQELFPTRTRVTAFAVSQNIGTLITAFLPTIYASIAGPAPGACVVNKKFAPNVVLPTGQSCRVTADAIETHVVWTVGSITFALAIIAAVAAFSARETYRIHLNDLGDPNARPIPKDEYDRIRAAA